MGRLSFASKMRMFPDGAPLRVRTDGRNQPATFVWLGETHAIESLEDVREPRLDWWSTEGEIHRLYYLVVTQRGLICELYRDLIADRWLMSRIFD